MRPIFRTFLDSPIIVEYNVWNHNFMLEIQELVFKLLEFKSLMSNTK